MNRISGTVSGRERQRLSSAPQHALGAHVLGEDGQRLAEAGAHLLGLAQHGGQLSGVVDAQAIGEGAPGVLARLAGAQLQHQEAQVDGEVRVAAGELLSDPGDGGVQAEAGLDRGHKQVQQIGEAVAVFALALGAADLQHLIGAHDGRARQDAGEGDAAHAALAAGDQRHEHDHAERGDRQRRGPRPGE